MELGILELVIIAGLGCGCVVLPLAVAAIILLVVRQGRRGKKHPSDPSSEAQE
jgi:hypothetical protein